MPIRMLRDWTDSETVNELDDGAEVLFVRLMMKADDYGRFSANPRLIRSLCFPLRDGIRESDISRRLAECEAAGLIATYESKGKPILQIVKFGQRLRQRTAKYDPPPPDVARRIAELCGECPPVAATCGLNGTRIEPEQEYEQEPEGNRGVKFCLWSGATAEELKTPQGAQRAFESVRDQGFCTESERLHVFSLLLSMKADKKIRNLARAFEGAIRGNCQNPWKSRGSDFDDQAREWQRSLDVPPEMQQRTSDLSTGPPSASIIDDHKRKLLEFEQKRKDSKT